MGWESSFLTKLLDTANTVAAYAPVAQAAPTASPTKKLSFFI